MSIQREYRAVFANGGFFSVSDFVQNTKLKDGIILLACQTSLRLRFLLNIVFIVVTWHHSCFFVMPF